MNAVLDRYRHEILSVETLRFLELFFDVKMNIPIDAKEGEVAVMCEAIRQMREESYKNGRDEGLSEGRSEGKEYVVANALSMK